MTMQIETYLKDGNELVHHLPSGGSSVRTSLYMKMKKEKKRSLGRDKCRDYSRDKSCYKHAKPNKLSPNIYIVEYVYS